MRENVSKGKVMKIYKERNNVDRKKRKERKGDVQVQKQERKTRDREKQR